MSTSVEFSPRTPEETTDGMAKRLVKDFYLSFKFSQGNVEAQAELLRGLVCYYGKHLSPEDRQWITNNTRDLLSGFMKLNTPKSHSGVDMQGNGIKIPMSTTSRSYRETEFELEGSEFIDMLALIGTEEYENEINVASVCTKLIRRDTHYQLERYPRSYQTTDQHESYFRSYVLLQKPTGSEGFNFIFAQVREAFMGGHLSEGLGDVTNGLVNAWQKNHLGHDFFPEYNHQSH